MRTAKQLKEIRKTLKMTQKELAEALCVERNYIYLVESGKKPISKKLDSALNRLLLPSQSYTTSPKNDDTLLKNDSISEKLDTVIAMLERIAIALERLKSD